MQFTFLDMANKVLFIRDDAERAQWSTHELSLDLEFPYLADKAISIGQRVFFTDALGNHQIYEIKQAKTLQPDNYQQITAEHICISELSDEHINGKEITDQKCAVALADLLENTLWSVGTKEVNPTSTVDLSRGSVWQAVLQIKDNFNVYIEPRVTLANDGTITRKLDILSTAGKWRGVRLSIDKNMLDPSVTFDDSEVATALYGYGGTIHDESGKGEDTECTFKDIEWKKTADHPAKPKGQAYLEDPTATREYGRNGRARFGFFQNNDITDPETLLQKTWETLQTVSTPAISIDGTVADLYRMGYADQPLALHDIALVEILPSGFKKQIQIIQMTVDLLDPSSTPLTIGSYIPNIIYIQRKTDMDATGSRGGGGGNKSKETEKAEFEAQIQSINAGTGLRFTAFQRDLDKVEEDVKLQEAAITVEHNRITAEVTDRREADNVLSSNITQTAKEIRAEVKSTASGLQSQITQNANSISLVVSDGKIKPASIVAAINDGSSSIKISADHIILDGQAVADALNSSGAFIGTLNGGGANFNEYMQCDGWVKGNSCDFVSGTVDSLSSSSFGCSGTATLSSVKAGGATHGVSWKSYTARYCDTTASYTFKDANGNNVTGRLVTNRTDTTIYYLGYS